MKDGIIRLNDYLCYLAIAILAFVGYHMHGVLGGLGGFIIGAVFAGFWLVLSAIYDEVKRIGLAKN
ncbi:hypothetical protein BIV08_04255 [Pseudomonas sp. AF76]|uniref:hypothetical protein n=1 Tax=Pseudomonas sp. AF76 TaxID=554393 RepID=UPI000F4702D0|nr:hypothetical protein [Pseudomonas sp. AF76]ROO35371.1 hypothetical protein BIV08_04255 [Pseudomonas sp. AF76]